MSSLKLIPIEEICSHYSIETTFISKLNELDLIEIKTFKSQHYIHEDTLSAVEKMIHLHEDLNINLEGIDTVFNLLDKIEQLQEELTATKNRLSIYE